MSKETRGQPLGKSLLVVALIVTLSGLLVILSACEDMGSEGPAPLYVDTSSGLTEGAGDVADAVTTTTPGATTTTAAEKSPAGDDDVLAEPTPSSLLVPATAGTMRPTLWNRFEEDDTRLNWVGMWQPRLRITGASGGYLRRAVLLWPDEPPRYTCVTFRFEGTRVRLVAWTHPFGLYGKVTLDGHLEFWVDYQTPQVLGTAPADLQQQIVWTSPVLAPGVHEVSLERTEERNPAYSESLVEGQWVFITFDAVEVYDGTLIPPFE